MVGEAASAAEAVRRTGFDSPDLVIMDVRLPDGSGVEACRDIRSGFPDVKVLMLTSYADEEALMAAKAPSFACRALEAATRPSFAPHLPPRPTRDPTPMCIPPSASAS